jgi:cytochrome b
MNTPSASRTDTAASTLVWDAPVRVVHWLMVLCFAGAWLTAESERWRLVHVTLGYTMAGLVGFRLVWGVIGSQHARFASFVRGPRAVASYLGSLLRGRPAHHAGHTPAGAVAIVALLILTLAVAASGWATDNELAGVWLEELHEVLAGAMLFVVAVHVVGVIVTSLLHRENLVRAMVTGRKPGVQGPNIRRPWRGVAVLVLAGILGFWALQWSGAASRGSLPDRHAASGKTPDPDDDQD